MTLWHYWHFGTFFNERAAQNAIVPKVPRKENAEL